MKLNRKRLVNAIVDGSVLAQELPDASLALQGPSMKHRGYKPRKAVINGAGQPE
jgi:hypothetical protein